jgi:hypothetical protein
VLPGWTSDKNTSKWMPKQPILMSCQKFKRTEDVAAGTGIFLNKSDTLEFCPEFAIKVGMVNSGCAFTSIALS